MLTEAVQKGAGAAECLQLPSNNVIARPYCKRALFFSYLSLETTPSASHAASASYKTEVGRLKDITSGWSLGPGTAWNISEREHLIVKGDREN